MKKIIFVLSAILLMAGCFKEQEMPQRPADSNDVTFLNKIEGYSFTAGEEVEIVAPISFEKELANEEEINELFDIKWFVNGDQVGEGYRIKYTFSKSGGYSLVLKIVNRITGETYLSDSVSVESRNSIGWGWMVLSDREGASSLSFIRPITYYTSHNLEAGIDDGLGTGPKRLFYYYVKGSIPSSNISGLAKIIVNQSSGTVTLDGSTLMKDKWMRDEFESSSEPEEDFTMTGFSWKETYYLITTASGNMYMKYVDKDHSGIPFYGTYGSMPYSFSMDSHISLLNGFNNVIYWVANETLSVMYDSNNARFMAMITGNGFDTNPTPYKPDLIELVHYDETLTFDPSVPPVYNLGAGTKCLALGAYEREAYIKYDTDGVTILSQRTYPKYVSLIDLDGTGNYKIYQFGVSPIGASNHNIVENTMEDFHGTITAESVIKLSTDFSNNPYFYYTDGANNLYVYGMEQKKSVLLYEAAGKITHLSTSPLDCPFADYGGNSTAANWKMAVVQEGGNVAILDVSTQKVLKLMEGSKPKIEEKTLSGFGNVKDIVWATNFVGEF